MALGRLPGRRRLVRAVVGYGIVSFALLQIVEPIIHGLHFSDATLTYFLVALGLAFPVVVLVSSALDLFGTSNPPATEGAGAPGTGRAWTARMGLGTPFSVALLVLAVAAIAVLVTLLATSRRPAVQPKLAQVTFAGGIEEYPAWSPDGKQLLYVARSGKVRKLFRHDLQTGKVTQLTHGDEDELQPAWSPDGIRVLFVRGRQPNATLQPGDLFGVFVDESDIWQLDLGSGKETWLVQNAFHPAYSPNGAQIAVEASWAGPRRIWVLDRLGQNPQQATTDSSEEVAHVAPSWSPDGRRLVFQNIVRTKFDVRVVDLDSKQVSWITNDFSNDIEPVWSPSGGFLYFSSDRGGGLNVWRAPVAANGTATSPLQQVTTGPGQDIEVALSADGKRMAFTTLRQNADIWRLPVSPSTGAATGAPEPVISTTREDSRGAWAPDASAIAFNSDRGGEMNIWLHALKDGSARQLTRGPGGDYQPNWSPDGSKLVFFSSRLGTPNIWQVEVATGKIAPLTSGPSVNVNPFFSPDGGHIAFQSDRSGRLEVWVMTAAGGGQRQLTHTGVGGHFLRWTVAGDAIVFRCTCGGKPLTMAVPLGGGEPAPFVDQKGGAHISFSPDHSRIMDVVGHRVLWVSPVKAGAPERVFEFSDGSVRIDYPVWSPDGRWILFDRTQPQGGDVWVMKDFE